MSEVCAIEAVIDLKAKDPIDVIANTGPKADPSSLAGLRPKSSFEIAWDLGH